MDDVILDGKCHAISKSYGVFGKYIPKLTFDLEDADDLLNKYAEYLYKNDKQKVIDYLLSIFRKQVAQMTTDDNFQIIFKPPYITSISAQNGTLCLKFIRSENDDLDVPLHQNEVPPESLEIERLKEKISYLEDSVKLWKELSIDQKAITQGYKKLFMDLYETGQGSGKLK